jgi:protein crumbs
MGQYCEIKKNETCFLETQCKNNGKCVDKYDSNGSLIYECICQIGFNGKNCENYVDYCLTSKPCQNNATCHNLRSKNSDQYACICQKGWKGLNCDQDIDECADFPNLCKNHAVCTNLYGTFDCMCESEFYYGQYCEHKHVCADDFHAPNEIRLCKNDGRCSIQGSIGENMFKCECENGYEGDSCTLVTCGTRPCRNNGTCVDLALNETIASIKYDCNCSNSGFTGPLCDDLIVINNSTFFCDANSTLQCDDQLMQFQRIVTRTSQFDNQDANLRAGRPGRDYMYHFIIWPLLGLMLILLMTLSIIIVMKMKKSRATRGTYSPSRHEQHSSRIEFNMDLKRPPEERLI